MTQVLTLLYVDDDEISLIAFKAAYKKLFHILTESTPSKGKKILKDHKIDIVLSDHNMPEETGISFLTYVASEYPKIKRVLVSGDNKGSHLNAALENGLIHAYLGKPTREEDVMKALDHINSL